MVPRQTYVQTGFEPTTVPAPLILPSHFFPASDAAFSPSQKTTPIKLRTQTAARHAKTALQSHPQTRNKNKKSCTAAANAVNKISHRMHTATAIY
jgi:hypothetical protein